LAPKEQPPRKLSGKRTVIVITLESRRKPHRRGKSLRYLDRWGKRGLLQNGKNCFIQFS